MHNDSTTLLPRRLSDWVLSGISVSVVIGSLVIIGKYAEKTSNLEKLIAKEEGARKAETKKLEKSLTELSKNLNEMVTAQKLTNQKLESIDKSTASIKDMKEVLILWQSQIQKSQYMYPQSYRGPAKRAAPYKLAEAQ